MSGVMTPEEFEGYMARIVEDIRERDVRDMDGRSAWLMSKRGELMFDRHFLLKEVDRLKRQVEAVRQLHSVFQPVLIHRYCSYCETDMGEHEEWPCDTIRALDGGAL